MQPVRVGILLFIAAFLVVGCARVDGVRYTYREPVRIEAPPFRLDGFYFRVQDSSSNDSDVVLKTMLFWEDGTAAFFPGHSVRVEGDSLVAFAQTVEEALAGFQECMRRDIIGRERDVSPFWGAYRVYDDTVSVQLMINYVSGGPARYGAVEDTGIAETDTSIRFHSSVWGRGSFSKDHVYRFHPLDQKPDSRNWTHTHPDLQ